MAATSAEFIEKSLRYVAELRRAAEKGARQDVPFPDDWFDLPRDRLADLGAMFFLSALSNFHRQRSLAQVFTALETPLRLGQYRLFNSDKGHPRAFLTWAGLDGDAEWQFAVDRVGLKPHQWNSGTSVWVADLVAPFGHIDQIVPALSATRKIRRLRTLWHNRKGTTARVIEWTRAENDDVQVTSYGKSQFAKLLKG